MEIVKITKNDVGKTITINGVKIDILEFEDSVIHIKLDEHTDFGTKFNVFFKHVFESHQYDYSDYEFIRKNPNLKLDEYLKVLNSYEYKEDIEPYVFVIHFRTKIEELKFIAKRKDKMLRKKVRVNVDI